MNDECVVCPGALDPMRDSSERERYIPSQKRGRTAARSLWRVVGPETLRGARMVPPTADDNWASRTFQIALNSPHGQPEDVQTSRKVLYEVVARSVDVCGTIDIFRCSQGAFRKNK